MPATLRLFAALASLVLGSTVGPVMNPGQAPKAGSRNGDQADTTERARARHVLNRLAFGPRPGEVERVAATGVDRYIEQQLHPERIEDRAAARYLARLEVLRLSPAELAGVYTAELQARLARQASSTPDSAPARGARRPPGAQDTMPAGREQLAGPRDPGAELPRGRRLAAEFQQAAAVRAVVSERQLLEVMVDFWTNHFNVFWAKGADRFLLPDYIEHAIRPNALGRFEDLLIATARSPAMLFYLDNVQSVAPGSRPPALARLERARGVRGGRPVANLRPNPGGFARGLAPQQMDSLRERIAQRLPRGINENYARELLELHTLGVDGGYTQEDVIAVARILTGWSMSPPRQGNPRFVFNDWAHDRGEKVVLGRTFPAGRGEEEGLELLRWLARQPATMRHVTAKLCARFVADDPPAGCIDAGVHAWERSRGDLREVLRAIFRSPDFWAPEHRNNKVKTPLEFVASAVRAVGGAPDTTLALAQLVARLGQPLYLAQPPTGYPETQESWVNAGALMERLNVAMGIAAGRARAVSVNLDDYLPIGLGAAELAERAGGLVLNGAASARTVEVIARQIADLPPEQARTMAVALALGSPEFQRQ